MSPQRPPGEPLRCILHIGTMKSGTTFIQKMLDHHRGDLADDGVLFPGRDTYGMQIRAVRDLVNMPGTVPAHRLAGTWETMRRDIVAWPGPTAVISVEQLSVIHSRRVAKVVAALAPAEVEVLITARDLARVLPSTWQENVQNGLVWTWPQFVDSVVGTPGAETAPGERFWRQQDLPRLVTTWAEHVGADRVHVLTLPQPGAPRDELWRRFCGLVGIDPARYPETSELQSNKGLDRIAAEMLRRVNARLDDGVDRGGQLRVLKHGLAKQGLIDAGNQLPIVLGDEAYGWTRRHATQMITHLRATGAQVVGDLDELVPPEREPVPVDRLREPTETEVADAAAAAVATLVSRIDSLSGRRRGGHLDVDDD